MRSNLSDGVRVITRRVVGDGVERYGAVFFIGSSAYFVTISVCQLEGKFTCRKSTTLNQLTGTKRNAGGLSGVGVVEGDACILSKWVTLCVGKASLNLERAVAVVGHRCGSLVGRRIVGHAT